MDSETENTQTEEVQSLLQRAEDARKSGDVELAAAIHSEAAFIEPDNSDILNKFFDIITDLLDINSAAALMIINFIQANYNGFEIDLFDLYYPLYSRGWDLIESGELARGEELLRTGIKFDPTNPDLKRKFGYFLLNQARYDEGISYLEEANDMDLSHEEEVRESLEAISWAEFKRGNIEEALDNLLRNFIYLSDERLPIIYLRSVRLLDDETAIEALFGLLIKLEEIESEGGPLDNQTLVYHEAWLELAKRFYSKGVYELAQKYFERVIEKVAGNADALLGLGRAYLELGSSERALELADQAAALETEDPEPLALRAKALLAQKDFTAAFRVAEKGLSQVVKKESPMVKEEPLQYFSPPNISQMESKIPRKERDVRPELLLSKVDALTGLERYAEALDTLRYARDLYPEEIIFYRYAAALLLKSGKPQDALVQFQLARKAGAQIDTPSKELRKKIRAALGEDKSKSIT